MRMNLISHNGVMSMLPRLAVLSTALLFSLSASAFELNHAKGQLKLAAPPAKNRDF